MPARCVQRQRHGCLARAQRPQHPAPDSTDLARNPIIAPSGKYFVKVWCGSGSFLMQVDGRIPCDSDSIPVAAPLKRLARNMAPSLDQGGTQDRRLLSSCICVRRLVRGQACGHSWCSPRASTRSCKSSVRDASFCASFVGSHPKSDALSRYSLYSHSVLAVHSVKTDEQQQLTAPARGARMKWERPLVPAKVDLSGRPLTDEEAKAAVVSGGRPSFGAHETRSLVVSNATGHPARVVVEISTQVSPLHVTVACNAWATSVLAHIDAVAAAAAHIAAAGAATAQEADERETEAPVADSQKQAAQECEISSHNSSDTVFLPAPQVVVPPHTAAMQRLSVRVHYVAPEYRVLR